MINHRFKFPFHRTGLNLVLIAFIGILSSLFFAAPQMEAYKWYLHDKKHDDVYNGYEVKKNDLLNNMQQYFSGGHSAKKAFRLTIPVIMRVFDLNMNQLLVLQIALGILIYYILTVILCQLTGSLLTTLLFILALSGAYFGRSYYFDTHPLGDTFSYFFIVLAIWLRRFPVLLFLITIALFFTDERGALSISLLWMFIKLGDKENPADIKFRDLISLKDNSLYVVLAVLVCVAVRAYLTISHDLSVPGGGENGVGMGVFFLNWRQLQKGLLSGLGALWGVVFLSIAIAFLQKEKLFAWLLLLCTLGFIFTSTIVYDITRSVAYLFPITLICIRYLRVNMQELNKVLFVVVIVNLFIPPMAVQIGDELHYPFYFDMLFYLANFAHSVLH